MRTRGRRMGLRQVGGDDLVDLLLAVRLEVGFDALVRAAAADDEQQLAALAGVGQDLLELASRGFRHRPVVAGDQAIADLQPRARGRAGGGDGRDEQTGVVLLDGRTEEAVATEELADLLIALAGRAGALLVAGNGGDRGREPRSEQNSGNRSCHQMKRVPGPPITLRPDGGNAVYKSEKPDRIPCGSR